MDQTILDLTDQPQVRLGDVVTVISERPNQPNSVQALAELAHSLKTPLAVLRSLLDGNTDSREVRKTLSDQTLRMHRTIDYQLQRAATSGPTPLAPAVDIAPLLRRLQDSLLKVYAHKQLTIDARVEAGIGFHGDEGDLMEILGNLLDNACKWANRRVGVVVEPCRAGGGLGIALRVEDDGPGFPADMGDAVLGHGVRGDESTPGHGIGLAVVRDIVREAYGGDITVGASDMGGAAVTISIPMA